MRIAKIEVRPHPKDPLLFNLFCVAPNGEDLWMALQGYNRRNVKRAVARIKANTDAAEIVFIERKKL